MVTGGGVVDSTYRRLLRTPDVPQLLGSAVVVRLGLPVLSLALPLTLIEGGHSYGTAGLVLTGHALALAVCAPTAGRLVDRFPTRPTLAWFAAMHAVTYSVLVAAVVVDVAVPLVVAAAALHGVSNPPTSAVVRAALPRLVPEDLLSPAYALDNMTNEVAFIAGPALVSVLVLVAPPNMIVAGAGAAVLLGLLILLIGRAVRDTTHSPTEPSTRTPLARLLGPLAHGPTALVLVVAAADTFVFGCLRIGTVAAAEASEAIAYAAVLAGLISVGALIGSLGYGARPWRVGPRRLLLIVCATEGALLLVGAATVPGLLVLSLVVVGVGVVSGVRETLQATLLALSASPAQRTEAFAWLTTFMWAGYGAGTAVAGALTGPATPGSAALVAAAASSALAVLLVALARTRRPHRADQPMHSR
jgi:MFS family permease